MRVSVDLLVCRGHGQCLVAAPAVFDEDAAGRTIVLLADAPEGLREQVDRAVANCPTRAIGVTE
ncbi:MAG: ferredoxin [Sporichthyaceae bacterium]